MPPFSQKDKEFHRMFDNFSDVFLQHIRNAGFEDGVDFKWDEGPESISPRLMEWLLQNKDSNNASFGKEMARRGFG